MLEAWARRRAINEGQCAGSSKHLGGPDSSMTAKPTSPMPSGSTSSTHGRAAVSRVSARSRMIPDHPDRLQRGCSAEAASPGSPLTNFWRNSRHLGHDERLRTLRALFLERLQGPWGRIWRL